MSINGCLEWNKLAMNITACPTFKTFKAQLTGWKLDKQTCQEPSESLLCVQLFVYGWCVCTGLAMSLSCMSAFDRYVCNNIVTGDYA